MVMVMVEDAAERPLNMRKRSLMVRYVDGGEDIGEHAGGHVGWYVGEDLDEDVGEDGGEDLDEDLDEDLGEDGGKVDVEEDEDLNKDLDADLEKKCCFWYSSRRCRCRRFFDENTLSQCLQDGLLQTFSCVCRMRRVIEENDALQSLQWWYSIGCGAVSGGACGPPRRPFSAYSDAPFFDLLKQLFLWQKYSTLRSHPGFQSYKQLSHSSHIILYG